jgi:YfiH family protein
MQVRDHIYRLPTLESQPGLLHGISTRVSPDGAYWNLSAKRGTPQHPPDAQVALSNRAKLASALGVRLEQMAGCQQVHGTEVALATGRDAGRGMLPGVPAFQGADGMITNTPGLYLMVLSADCPPVFLYDPVQRAIGLAHSGWKGTVGRIAAKTLHAMSDHFGTVASDVIAAVGPGIGPCCYSVGPNVVDAVSEAFGGAEGRDGLLEQRDGLVFFSLREAIRRALEEAGVRPGNVSVDETCTAHSLDVFYSHRGERGQCGLFGAVFGLRDD